MFDAMDVPEGQAGLLGQLFLGQVGLGALGAHPFVGSGLSHGTFSPFQNDLKSKNTVQGDTLHGARKRTETDGTNRAETGKKNTAEMLAKRAEFGYTKIPRCGCMSVV